MRLLAVVGEREVAIEVREVGGRLRVAFGGEEHELDARVLSDGSMSVLIDRKSYEVDLDRRDDRYVATVRGRSYALEVLDERRERMRLARATMGGQGPQIVVSPMPGRVVRVHVVAGDKVAAGQPLVVVEAMKMENELKAAREGVVQEVSAAVGKAVESGERLVTIV